MCRKKSILLPEIYIYIYIYIFISIYIYTYIYIYIYIKLTYIASKKSSTKVSP